MDRGRGIVDRLLASPKHAFDLLGEGPARTRTQLAVRAFFRGAAEARAAPSLESLAGRLVGEPVIAWEGVGLYAALHSPSDVTGGRICFDECLRAYPRRASLLCIGLGWADALAGRACEVDPEALAKHPIERELRLDGQGFWSGLRHGARMSESRQRRPDRSEGSGAIDLFDQGVGRSLYFSLGGRSEALWRAIEARGRARGSALWTGVGIAAIVTGGLGEREPGELDRLREIGGDAVELGFERGAGLRATEP